MYNNFFKTLPHARPFLAGSDNERCAAKCLSKGDQEWKKPCVWPRKVSTPKKKHQARCVSWHHRGTAGIRRGPVPASARKAKPVLKRIDSTRASWHASRRRPSRCCSLLGKTNTTPRALSSRLFLFILSGCGCLRSRRNVLWMLKFRYSSLQTIE